MIRDTNNMALLNADADAFNKYKEQKKQHLFLKNMREDIDSLKTILMNIQLRLEKIEERL